MNQAQPDRQPFAPNLLERISPPPRKVVVLRASRIGDFLCAVPAFRALRGALPDAEITLLTLPMLRDLAGQAPFFDHFLPFPGFPWVAEQLFDARRTIRFLREAQEERFDLAIQMQGSGVYSNPFTLLLGARFTAGFIRLGEPAGRLDAAFPLPESGHEIDRMLSLTSFLGAPSMGREIDLVLHRKEIAEAYRLLDGVSGPLIGVHPAARDRTRRWDPGRFAEAAGQLCRRFGGTVVLLGEPEERESADQVARLSAAPTLNLMGQTSLASLAAVIARLDLLLTNDTGPAHLAYAFHTPSVTIFGGGDPLRYGPPSGGPHRVLAYEVPCRPCAYVECPIDYLCLENVTVASAVQAGAEVIRKIRPAPLQS